MAYSYPGMWALQFMAFYNPEAVGLYFAAHDPEARFKRFGFYGESGSREAELVMQHYPDERLTPGLSYETPYDTAIGLFTGEWWKASEVYREWAIQQKWCRKGPLAERRDIPQWLLETDLWYWNWRHKPHLGSRGTSEDVVPAILNLKQKLDTGMAFHWYEWDGKPFNQDIPPVLPVKRDAGEGLARALDELHDAGVRAIPYINARLWDIESPSWEAEGAATGVCLDQDGEHADRWSLSDGRKWSAMCPHTTLWQEKVRSVCEALVFEYGFDGVYADQITSCFVVPCFASDHDHARGGGNSWYAGYRQMMERIQGETKQRNPEAVYTSESTIDCYLDLFDANLAREANELSVRHDEQWLPIPLFHSVYHDYAITYGSVLQLTEVHPRAFFYGEALVLVGGQQLMVEGYLSADVGTDRYSEYLEYLGGLVQARKRAREYLLFGRWLPPVEMEVDDVEVAWSKDHPQRMYGLRQPHR
jgi:hypothetical protein